MKMKIADLVAKVQQVLMEDMDVSVGIETRAELVADLLEGIGIEKNGMLAVKEKFLGLCQSDPEFAKKVSEIRNECFSGVDEETKQAYDDKVSPVAVKYVDNPDKENRKMLRKKIYEVLAITSDVDVIRVVEAERKLWKAFLSKVK